MESEKERLEADKLHWARIATLPFGEKSTEFEDTVTGGVFKMHVPSAMDKNRIRQEASNQFRMLDSYDRHLYADLAMSSRELWARMARLQVLLTEAPDSWMARNRITGAQEIDVFGTVGDDPGKEGELIRVSDALDAFVRGFHNPPKPNLEDGAKSGG